MQIVTDSIAKYVEGIRQAEILAFPGININQLVHKIETGRLILDKKIVLFHVGTNNIERMDSGSILSCFNNLISVVRRKSSAQVVISCILPRPKDHFSCKDKAMNANKVADEPADKVKAVNKGLVHLCKERKVRLLHTFNPFIRFGKPRRELFAINDQGLHLNIEGTRRLRQFFSH